MMLFIKIVSGSSNAHTNSHYDSAHTHTHIDDAV